MILVSRLLGCLLPLAMAAALTVAPANARDGHAAESAVQTGLLRVKVLHAQLQQAVDHSSKRPRIRASLEEFFELDDDTEQHFKEQPALLAHLLAGVMLLPRPQACIHRADVPRQRPCASYPTGPPQA